MILLSFMKIPLKKPFLRVSLITNDKLFFIIPVSIKINIELFIVLSIKYMQKGSKT